MKKNLINEANRLMNHYGSYLATEVFRKERKRLGRIKNILFFRYKLFVNDYRNLNCN